ncbi:MAG: dATP/dGTP diphosphohydrolase domain-containing protein, partial [Solirubrobacterales bacterium]
APPSEVLASSPALASYPGVFPEDTPAPATALPTGAAARKSVPMAIGLLDYFPGALAEVARCSRVANEHHNPGEPVHWARGKSTDHADCILRHLVDRGTVDDDGVLHSAKVAWRALALLQEELEAAGAKPGRGSWFPDEGSF